MGVNQNVAHFYYTETLPPRSVAIGYIRSKPSTPSDLTDINNLFPNVGALKAGRLTCTGWPIARTVDAVILNNTVELQGNKIYYMENQFFEITNVTDPNGTPLYYRHPLPQGVDDVTVFKDNNEEVTDYVVDSGNLYHSLVNGVYWVRYYDGKTLRTDLLKFYPTMTQVVKTPTFNTYVFEHGVLYLYSDTATYYLRFTEDNGYQILSPYNVLATEPWYVRLRTNIRPVAPEWGRQLFMPFRPYMLATWVPAQIVGTNLVEFERKPILFDGKRYPDILIFDKDYNFKYALDGTPVDSISKKGFLYPWRRAQVLDMDVYAGRLKLAVPLESTDQVFGFYYYKEPDVLYRDLDINPFTNPDVKDRVVEIVYHPNSTNPFQNLYHRVLDETGQVIPELSNVPEGEGDDPVVIGTLLVGGSVGLNEFTVEDSRTKGGGLASEHKTIPEAKDFWDLGFWDGQPFPVGGATVVYLPDSLLKPVGQFTRTEVEQVVRSVLPMGVVPVIRYYDNDGEESLGASQLPFDSLPGSFDSIPGLFDTLGVR